MGLIIDSKTVSGITLGNKDVALIKNSDNSLMWEKNSDYFYFEDLSGASNSITLTKYGDNAEWINLQYSTDKMHWSTWNLSNSLSLPANSKVYLRNVANNGLGANYNNYHTFSSTGNVKIGGRASSLNHESPSFNTIYSRGLHYAFNNMTTLIDASDLELPDVLTSGNEFTFTFQNCSNLTAAPDLSSVTTVGGNSMYSMFSGCTSLTTVPDLSSVTTVGSTGMYGMFSNCTSLTTAPDLSSVTTVGSNGMQNMFSGCTALTTPPDLSSVTTVDTNGMHSMFINCTHLSSAPDMSNITNVGACNGTFTTMFKNCTSLVTAPDLSGITVVGSSGIDSMFHSCTSLTTPPNLSNVTSVGNYGMSYLFSGCTHLQSAPDFSNITSVGTKGMQYVFNGCSLINCATAPNVSSWDTTNMAGWLNNVASTGTVHKSPSLTIPSSSTSGIPTNWTASDYVTEYFYVETSSYTGTLTFENMSGKNIEYSTDKQNWTTADLSSTYTVSVPANSKLYLRGNNSAIGSSTAAKHISMPQMHNFGGNVLSLLDKTNFGTMTSINTDYAFGYLFYNNTGLYNTPNMNFGRLTNVGSNCMYGMFRDCTYLYRTGDLCSVTTVGTNGLRDMYYGCTGLYYGPKLSKVTSVGNYGMYQMFFGSHLTTAPDLRSLTTVGNYGMYKMFYDCQYLQEPINLSRLTTIGNYSLCDLYINCERLKKAYAPNVSSWDSTKTNGWLYGVYSSGTVYKPSALTIPTGTFGVPSGWTTQNY